jgi:hypothetical protein
MDGRKGRSQEVPRPGEQALYQLYHPSDGEVTDKW